MKEYKYPKALAVLFAVFAVGFLVPPIGFGIGFIEPPSSTNTVIVIVSSCLLCSAFFFVTVAEVLKARAIITDNLIEVMSVFGTRKLYVTDIKGYHILNNMFYLVPLDPQKKRIGIDKYFRNSAEMRAWAISRFPDVEELAAKEEKENILADVAYGIDVHGREERLKMARKLTIAYNWVACLIAVWAFVYPEPYKVTLVFAMLMPPVAAGLVRYFRGLVHVNKSEKSPHPAVFMGLFFSSVAVALRALMDFNLLDYSKVWLPAGGIAVLFVVLFFWRSKEVKDAKGKFGAVLVTFCLFGYGYGSTVLGNCAFDDSAPQHFITTVTGKRIAKGKNKTYYLELAPWGPVKEKDEVRVKQPFYNSVSPGDAVGMVMGKGRFEMPWYVVVQ